MLHRCACLQNFLKLSTDVNTFKILNRGGGGGGGGGVCLVCFISGFT